MVKYANTERSKNSADPYMQMLFNHWGPITHVSSLNDITGYISQTIYESTKYNELNYTQCLLIKYIDD